MPYDRWVLVPQDFFEALAKRRDLRGETLRVFFHLAATVGFQNEIKVNPLDTAKALGMRRENVYRALKQLRELGLVVDTGRKQPTSVMQLSPHACWKGSPKELKAARAARPHHAELGAA